MTPFYGDKNKPKILGKINGKTFYWNIDTGSPVTCMNINSFEIAFRKKTEGQEKYNHKKRKCAHSANYTPVQ